MTSHIASRISRTRWKNVFLAQTSSISIFTTPGAVMKRLVIFAGSRKCPGEIASQLSEAERGRSVFMYLRVNTLNKLVPYAARRFIDNLPAIFTGTLIMRCWRTTAIAVSYWSSIKMWR